MTDQMLNTRGEVTVQIEAPVAAVTVLEDRAQVIRRAAIDLTAGRHLLVIDGVTPLLADQTLRWRIVPEKDGQADPKLLDLRLERRYIVRAQRPEQERELTAAIEELVEQYLTCYDEVQPLVHQRELFHQATDGIAQQLGDQLFLGRFEADAAADISKVFTHWHELEDRLVALYWQQEERSQQLQRLEEKRRRALQPYTEYRAKLYTELELVEAGGYQLEWEYLVPCAIWRPEYHAELEQRGETEAKVQWRSGGTVWQSTGEDWDNVKLSLSTARPTLGAELPLLNDDRLQVRQKSDQEKTTIRVESRDEDIATTSGDHPERSATPPGLDDGGEARTYVVPGQVTLPADGLPHRLEFDSWSVQATTEIRCLPERAVFAFARSTQRNPSNLPLLAGPVALTRQGGYIGQSEIRYVAPQEKFSLSWGSEDGLAVKRQIERRFNEAGLLRQKRYEFEVEIFLSNHTGRDQTLHVVERLPVSELEQVKVQVDKATTPGSSTDEQGHLTWKVELPQGASQQFKLAFNVTMPNNVHWKG